MRDRFCGNCLAFVPPALRVRALAAACALALAAVPLASQSRRARAPSTGLRTVVFAKAPPDFDFDAGGVPTHLAALAGRPVVISFWASWCEPCRAELPAFGRLRTTYGDAVSLLTISDEAPGRARAFLEARHLDLPVIEDPQRKIFEAYSITPIPVTLVLRTDGTVSFVSVGETSWDELAGAVSAALTPAAGAVSSPPP